MKILHLYKTYYPETFGGCEKVIQNLAEATSRLGCENILLTTTRSKNASSGKMGSLQVERFPETFSAASCPVSISLWRAFKYFSEQTDVIHYHFPWPFSDFLQLIRAVKKPTIVTYQSDIVRQKFLKIFYQPIMHAFLKRVDCIVTTSKNYEDTSPVLSKFSEKCVQIPNGVDEHEYSPINTERLSFWKNTVGENFLLFVGVLRYYKGLQFLLDAVANTNIPVVIAGSGPMEMELKQQAERLQLSNVKFLGFISDEDKNALYSLCKIVVMPSHLRSEAFGISLVEGALFGKPLISTEMGTGTSFINKNNVTGYTVPPADVSALRTAIQKLFENEALCAEMGNAARARYENLFTAEKMGQKYFEVYCGVQGDPD